MVNKQLCVGAFMILLLVSTVISVQGQECQIGLTVETDLEEYDQGSEVTVSGTYFDSECDPVVIPGGIGVQVYHTDNPHSPFFVNMSGTDENGTFQFTFFIPGDATTGSWQIIAAHGGNFDTDDFQVEEPTEEPTPEPPPASPPSGGGGGGGGCYPSWSCTEWGTCQSDGTQTRVCTDRYNCNSDLNKPDEEQSCTYTGGTVPETCEEDWSCTEWSVCADEQQTRACTDQNNCETEENKPAETQACVTEPETPPEGGGPPTGLFLDPATMGIGLIVLIILLGGGVYFWKKK